MEKRTSMQKYDLPEMAELVTIQKEIMDECGRLKNQIWDKVVEMALGRPFTLDDAKDFTVTMHEGRHYELVSYKGLVLVSIRFKAGLDSDDFKRNCYSAGWQFDPTEKDFSKP
jgi:hypothetical protein